MNEREKCYSVMGINSTTKINRLTSKEVLLVNIVS